MKTMVAIDVSRVPSRSMCSGPPSSEIQYGTRPRDGERMNCQAMAATVSEMTNGRNMQVRKNPTNFRSLRLSSSANASATMTTIGAYSTAYTRVFLTSVQKSRLWNSVM